MKLSDNNIDKLFKSKLQNQEFEVTDAFLNDLDNRLTKVSFFKKNWKLALLLSIVGLVIIVFSISKFGITSNSEIVNYSENKTVTNMDNSNSVVSHIEYKNIKSNTNNYQKNSQTESGSFTQKNTTTKPTTSAKRNVPTLDNSQLNAENYLNNTTPVKEKLKDNAVSEVSGNNSHKNTTEVPKKSNSIKNDEQGLKNESDIKNVSENDWAKNNSETKEESQVMESLSETTANISSQKTDNQKKDTLSIPKNSTDSSNPTKDSSLKTKSIAENDLPATLVGNTTESDSTNSKGTQPETETTPLATTTIEDIPKLKKIGVFLTLESGLNISSALYNGLESDFYENNHLENKTINYKFDANLLYKQRFLIGTGLGFNTYKNHFEYNTFETTYDTTLTNESVYVLDSFLYVFDTIVMADVIVDSVYHYELQDVMSIDSTTTGENNNGITKANYFSIPLNIGYQFPYKKFLFEVQGNLRYNILQNTSGGYYLNNTFIEFDKLTNSLYKKSYIDYSFKLGVHYNIWRQLYLSSSIRFAPRFSSVYSINEIEKKIQVTNLSIGLSYNL